MTKIQEIKTKCMRVVEYIEFIEERQSIRNNLNNMRIEGVNDNDAIREEVIEYAKKLINEEIREKEKAVFEMVNEIKPETKPHKNNITCELECFECPFEDCITKDTSWQIEPEFINQYKEYVNGR